MRATKTAPPQRSEEGTAPRVASRGNKLTAPISIADSHSLSNDRALPGYTYIGTLNGFPVYQHRLRGLCIMDHTYPRGLTTDEIDQWEEESAWAEDFSRERRAGVYAANPSMGHSAPVELW